MTRSPSPAAQRRSNRNRLNDAEVRDHLLRSIRSAGVKGINSSQLKKNWSKRRDTVFAELVRNREVRSLRDGRSVKYFLSEFETAVEEVYEAIDCRLPERHGPLLLARDIRAEFQTPAARVNVPAAIQALIKEKRLLQIERGHDTFYIHLPSLASLVECAATQAGRDVSIDPEKVLAAWRNVRNRTGIDDVSLHELRATAGLPRDGFATWLLGEMRGGRWLLSTGDPLYLPENQRADAIESNGRTFLFARPLT